MVDLTPSPERVELGITFQFFFPDGTDALDIFHLYKNQRNPYPISTGDEFEMHSDSGSIFSGEVGKIQRGVNKGVILNLWQQDLIIDIINVVQDGPLIQQQQQQQQQENFQVFPLNTQLKFNVVFLDESNQTILLLTEEFNNQRYPWGLNKGDIVRHITGGVEYRGFVESTKHIFQIGILDDVSIQSVFAVSYTHLTLPTICSV